VRLLTDSGPTLREHVDQHGALPTLDQARLLDQVDRSGLRGRGGAGFPTGRKLRTVSAGRRPVVLANGCEGEPAAAKDVTLMSRHPHLVLDGIAVAARAVGAVETHLALHAGSAALPAVRRALGERPQGVVLHEVPDRYVASEETALVNLINTGVALPTFGTRPFEQGIGNRPTLVNNVETLANLALIARHGAEWFRSVGDSDEPGTLLLTVTHDGVRRVLEVPTGTALGGLVPLAGVRAVLVGGYFGAWLPVDQVHALALTHRDLRAASGALGAGVVVTLPVGSCGVAETARIAGFLAEQNAGQCGPCINGLPAIAAALSVLAHGGWDDAMMPRLDRWLGVVAGRGACRHPDGAVQLVRSALVTFASDVAAHRVGSPCVEAPV
jgi:NADH:ubiquinone oxidoreductase subunit F (NADH-binding)